MDKSLLKEWSPLLLVLVLALLWKLHTMPMVVFFLVGYSTVIFIILAISFNRQDKKLKRKEKARK